MSDATTATIVQTVLDWVKAPWKMFTILFLISTSLLAIPNSWLRAIGMISWVQGHWTPLVLVSAFSGLFLAITVIEEQVKPILARRNEKRATEEKYSKIERILKSLKPDEAGILTHFNQTSSTHTYQASESIVRNLAIKGVLQHVHNNGYCDSYSLAEDVERYLTDRGFTTVTVAMTKLRQQDQ